MATPYASAILVAAGRSTRMGTQASPKPLLALGGKPVIAHSLAALCATQSVGEVLIVTQPEWFEAIEVIAAPFGDWSCELIEGGAERFHSVRAGCLRAHPESEVLLIHDAARPLVRPADIDRVAEAARQDGAAVLASPVTDSLHRSMDGRKAFEPVDRSSLWAAQTPQAFKKKPFLEALDEALRIGIVPTDDVALYERFKGAVTLVPGPAGNIKITHPPDLTIAEALLRLAQTP